MREYLVYLAGPIAGCNKDQALQWRLEAVRILANHNIVGLNPLRGKQKLWDRGSVTQDFNDYDNLGPYYTSRSIMTRDFSDVKRCDLLLANLSDAPVPSYGTVMEIGWAWEMQKPIVSILPEGENEYEKHPMLYEAMGGLKFYTLRQALSAAINVLGVS